MDITVPCWWFATDVTANLGLWIAPKKKENQKKTLSLKKLLIKLLLLGKTKQINLRHWNSTAQ
jgi:hypothetical protein